jgi:hypothetical protein
LASRSSHSRDDRGRYPPSNAPGRKMIPPHPATRVTGVFGSLGRVVFPPFRRKALHEFLILDKGFLMRRTVQRLAFSSILRKVPLFRSVRNMP